MVINTKKLQQALGEVEEPMAEVDALPGHHVGCCCLGCQDREIEEKIGELRDGGGRSTEEGGAPEGWTHEEHVERKRRLLREARIKAKLRPDTMNAKEMLESVGLEPDWGVWKAKVDLRDRTLVQELWMNGRVVATKRMGRVILPRR